MSFFEQEICRLEFPLAYSLNNQIWLAPVCLCRLVPRVSGEVFLSGLVAGEQLTEGGTSGTEDAEEELAAGEPGALPEAEVAARALA